ncbi:MAG: TolC family protein [Acidobacteriota bacterium]
MGLVGIAKGEAAAAGRWANPSFAYAREQTGGPPDGSTEGYFLFSQSLDLSGSLRLRREAAERRVGSATLDVAHRRLAIAAEIQRGFYEVLSLQQRVECGERWLGKVQEVLKMVAKREEAGDISGYDRRRLERERASIEVAIEADRGLLERAGQNLAAMLGIEDPPEASGDLLPSAPPLPIDQLLGRVPGRADLRSLAESAEAAEMDGRAAGRWWMPSLDIGAGLKRVDIGDRRVTGPLFQATVSLPIFNRNQGEKLVAESLAKRARAEQALGATRAAGEIRGIYMQAVRLGEAAKRFGEEAGGYSADLVRIAEAAYKADETGVLELVDAYHGALEAETKSIQIALEARNARIDLELAAGAGGE